MSVAAFIHKQYDFYSIKGSFAGVYDTKQDALDTLRGDRYDNQYLELFDLDTYGMTQYVWNPTFEFDEVKEGFDFKVDRRPLGRLKRKYGDDPEIIIKWYDDGINEWRYEPNQSNRLAIEYYAGDWEQINAI